MELLRFIQKSIVLSYLKLAMVGRSQIYIPIFFSMLKIV